MISSTKPAPTQRSRILFSTIALLLAATLPLSFAAKACKLSYKQLPNMSGSYEVKGAWTRTLPYRLQPVVGFAEIYDNRYISHSRRFAPLALRHGDGHRSEQADPIHV